MLQTQKRAAGMENSDADFSSLAPFDPLRPFTPLCRLGATIQRPMSSKYDVRYRRYRFFFLASFLQTFQCCALSRPFPRILLPSALFLSFVSLFLCLFVSMLGYEFSVRIVRYLTSFCRMPHAVVQCVACRAGPSMNHPPPQITRSREPLSA